MAYSAQDDLALHYLSDISLFHTPPGSVYASYTEISGALQMGKQALYLRALAPDVLLACNAFSCNLRAVSLPFFWSPFKYLHISEAFPQYHS